MNNTMLSFVLLTVTLFMCNIAHTVCDDKAEDAFYVKPGGQDMTFEKEWNNFKCKFEYQAQGGTHEQWQVSMETIDNGQNFMCTIARGQTSYLYFETFVMTVSGPGLSLEQFEAIDTGNKPLAESEYKMDSTANTFSAVAGKFQHHLERITLLASVAKTEL